MRKIFNRHYSDFIENTNIDCNDIGDINLVIGGSETQRNHVMEGMSKIVAKYDQSQHLSLDYRVTNKDKMTASDMRDAWITNKLIYNDSEMGVHLDVIQQACPSVYNLSMSEDDEDIKEIYIHTNDIGIISIEDADEKFNKISELVLNIIDGCGNFFLMRELKESDFSGDSIPAIVSYLLLMTAEDGLQCFITSDCPATIESFKDQKSAFVQLGVNIYSIDPDNTDDDAIIKCTKI